MGIQTRSGYELILEDTQDGGLVKYSKTYSSFNRQVYRAFKGTRRFSRRPLHAPEGTSTQWTSGVIDTSRKLHIAHYWLV